REAPDARVLVAEADELGPVVSGEIQEHAVEARERLVPIARDGTPPVHITGIEARPAPLVLMPVPVPDEDVHQARCEIGARVDPIAGAVLEVLEELLGPGELDRAGEPLIVVRRLRGALLD